MYSELYLEFAKWRQSKEPMTNTQSQFAQWLLSEEVVKELTKIGDLTSIFSDVRQFSKEKKL